MKQYWKQALIGIIAIAVVIIVSVIMTREADAVNYLHEGKASEVCQKYWKAYRANPDDPIVGLGILQCAILFELREIRHGR